MPYIRIPGITGKVYVPDRTPRSMKKHGCRDCYVCQWCSDSRCDACLEAKRSGCRKGRR